MIAVGYLDGRRLSRSVIAGARFVAERAEPLNKINVFPVPDGDTGTNLAATLQTLIPEMLRAALPLFVRVTAWAALVVLTCWLPKETEEGVRVTAGIVPLPERLAVCGLLVALSVTLRLAERAPVALGMNWTLMVQLELAASELPQLFVWAKSALLVPVKAILEIVSPELVELESVRACDALVVPTCRLPKEMDDGVRDTVAVVPMPVRLAV